MATEQIEFRCPRNYSRMFGILYRDPSWNFDIIPTGDVEYIEFSCQHCQQSLRKRGLQVARVLHRYDMTGEHLATEHVPQP